MSSDPRLADASEVTDLRLPPPGHDPLPGGVPAADARRAQMIDRLEQVARLDPTTGLTRRLGVIERIASQLPGPGPAVAVFQVRRLRALNSALGHSVVDGLLGTLGRRLASSPHVAWAGVLGPGMFFVELATSLREVPDEQAELLVKELRKPIELDRWLRVPDVVASVVLPGPGHLDADQILRDLDTGTAAASEEERVVLVDQSRRSTGLRRSRVESDLASAISGGDLRFRYQPIVRMADARPVAVEALARWRHPALGPIGPDEFVTVAEGSELIHALGDRALEDSLTALASWHRTGCEVDLVHVNVSAVQLTQPGLVTRIAELIDDHDVPPGRLEVEVTESAVLDTSGMWRHTLRALRELGVRIAIDDFGAGFSSLLSLRDVEADTVKLDRSMIEGIATSEGARSLVQATIDLAHRFGMLVVAEGVEVAEDHRILTDLGCDFGQGWLWHRDLEADEIAELWQRG